MARWRSSHQRTYRLKIVLTRDYRSCTLRLTALLHPLLEQVIAMVIQDVGQTVSPVADDATGGVHRVLVAFDGSEGAWAALRRAIEVAVANHALLTIAAVVEEPLGLWMGFGAITVPGGREVTLGVKIGRASCRERVCLVV